MIKRTTQGLGALATDSRLRCSQSARGRQIQPCLHEDKELIFCSKLLPFDGRFNR